MAAPSSDAGEVIGLTGSYCAGKNAVADILASKGWAIIDEDAVGHEALAARRDAIVEEFSSDILDSTGEISRRALAKVVFSSSDSLARLESIVHPWMVAETHRRAAGHDRAVINAAILFKMGLHELCDSVIVVKAWVIVRIIRCMRRDGATLGQIIKRLRAQRGLNRAPECVDIHIVRNTGSRRRLARRVERVLKRRYAGNGSGR